MKLSNIILISCIFIFQIQCALASDFEQQKINSAVEIVKNYGYKENIAILEGQNYTKKPVHILFKDLSEVDFAYAKFYAITATDDYGDLYILINNDLKHSDVKALACLILHESTHCRENKADSVSEEMYAHTQEVMLYNRILNEDESLQNLTGNRLIVRLNKLKKIYDDAIRAYIISNTNYVNYLKQ